MNSNTNKEAERHTHRERKRKRAREKENENNRLKNGTNFQVYEANLQGNRLLHGHNEQNSKR